MRCNKFLETLGNIPIRRKLILSIMATSLMVVLLSTGALMANKVVDFRQSLVEHLSTLASVIGYNSTAALSFGDQESARETLTALKAEPSIGMATISRKAGGVFVTYRRDRRGDQPDGERSDPITSIDAVKAHHRFYKDHLDLWQPIILDGEHLGTLYLRADLNALYTSLMRHLFILVIVLASALSIAYLMSILFQKLIAGPILHLVEVARSVSVSKNYSIRAEGSRGDEFGVLIGSFNDMLTEIEQRDTELEAHRNSLEEQVAQRTAELSKINRRLKLLITRLAEAKKAAEAANQAKSKFLANMSHELRTPLNHIIGFTELVVDQNLGPLNNSQAEYLNDALESSRHLLSLINDILDLSKISAGKLELDISEIHLPVLLENSLIMIREKAAKHGITLETELNGIPDTIQADERKLKQILYNLLSNAVKFTPDGGRVCLGANLDGRQGDEENGEKAGNVVCISVADTGIGIAAKDLGRIFAPFEQVENSSSRRYQGTGLGLSLSRQLVELHGGRIWAHSKGKGYGSTFAFTVPLDFSKAVRLPKHS